MSKNKPIIILASASSARKKVLNQINLDYKIIPSNFEENMAKGIGETWADVATRIALGKARDVAKSHKNALVIGADSFSVFNNKPYPKPGTYEKVKENLKKFSGKKLIHYTGMAVIDTTAGKEVTTCSIERLSFIKIPKKDIDSFVKKEDTRNFAGGFKIEGMGALLVKKIEGDYYGIVGISVVKISEMFKKLGYNILDFINP